MKLFAAIILLVGAVVLHFVGVFTGVYDAQLREGFVWYDNVLHALVGAAFALVWLYFFTGRFSGMLLVLSTISFVALMALAWELFEYGFYLVFKSGALGLKVYSPTIGEALRDGLSNVLGALLFLVGWSTTGRAVEEPAE
jgi:hypothetical protein